MGVQAPTQQGHEHLNMNNLARTTPLSILMNEGESNYDESLSRSSHVHYVAPTQELLYVYHSPNARRKLKDFERDKYTKRAAITISKWARKGGGRSRRAAQEAFRNKLSANSPNLLSETRRKPSFRLPAMPAMQAKNKKLTMEKSIPTDLTAFYSKYPNVSPYRVLTGNSGVSSMSSPVRRRIHRALVYALSQVVDGDNPATLGPSPPSTTNPRASNRFTLDSCLQSLERSMKLHEGALTVQRAWKRHIEQRRHEHALVIQLWIKELWRQEDVMTRAMHRFVQRKLLAFFNTWCFQIRKKIELRARIHRHLAGTKEKLFMIWKENALASKEEKKRRLANILYKIKNRTVCAVDGCCHGWYFKANKKKKKKK